MKFTLQCICLAMLTLSGCGKEEPSENTSLNLHYYLLVGDIIEQNGIDIASGMPFDSPVTVFINGNPVITGNNPSFTFVTPYITSGQNTVSVQTDLNRNFDVGVYYQDRKTISKEILKTSLNNTNSLANFNIDKAPAIFRSFPLDVQLPEDNTYNRQQLRNIIKDLHKNIESRNAQQVVNTLYKGRIQNRTNHGIQTKKHELTVLDDYIKLYSRTDFTVKPFNIDDIDFIWGKTIVVAYNKDNLANPYKNIMKFEVPEGAKSMPLIQNLKFIFVNGEWIIW